MSIKAFGTIDRRSLDQLERCMEAGDGDLGVLCADHHPGYSQPIGGVVAYREGLAVRRRLRHRLRQQGRADRTDARRLDVPTSRASWTRSRAGSRFGIGRTPTSAPTIRCSTRIRDADSRRSAARRLAATQLGTVGAATTTSTCSRTRRAGSGSASTSARAASATRPRRASCARAGARVRRPGRTRARWTRRRRCFAVDSELGAGLHRRDGARRRVRLRRPRVVVAQGARDPRRRGERRGAQPPQLRLAEEHFGRDYWVVRKGARRRCRARRASSAARWATTR